MRKADKAMRCGIIGLAVGLVGSTVGVVGGSAPLAAQTTYTTRSGASNEGSDTHAQSRSTQSKQSSGQKSRQVSLNVRDSTLAYIVRSLAHQAKLQVVYDNTDRQFAQRATVRISNKPVLDAFAAVLKGRGLTAKLTPDGETIVISSQQQDSTEKRAATATGTIMGRITDSATGLGLSGVTVTVQGTKLGALTTPQGIYSIEGVPVGEQRLSVRLVGYRSATLAITVEAGKRVNRNIILNPAATTLSEVVTTVTGEQRKLTIGNDVTTIDVEDVIKKAPVTTVTDLLETRVPGLTVTRTSGVPGAPSRIRLRGVGGGLLANQIGGATNDPIVIVDGIRIHASQSSPTDQNLAPGRLGAVSGTQNFSSDFPPPSAIDQIDINSIDKIEVFKGPSASALYGSDAANGVIVITTKRGLAGPTRWSLTANQGVDYMPGFYAAPGYYPFGHLPLGATGDPQICTIAMNACIIDSLVRFQALNIPRLSTMGRGHSSGMSATVSGGTSAITYSVTGTTTDEVGLLKMPSMFQDVFKAVYDSAPARWMKRPTSYKMWGMNSSFVAEPRRGLRTTLMLSLSNSTQQQSSASNQLSSLAARYIDTTNLGPEAVAPYVTRVTSEARVINTSLNLNWDAWRNLPLSATVGVNTNDKQDRRFVPYGIIGGTGFRSVARSDTLGFYGMGRATNTTQTARVNGTLFPGWKVSTGMGLEVTKTARNDFQGSMDTLAPGLVIPSRFREAGQRSASYTTGGWFLEPRLNLNSRFFVNPGFRLDGNSASGSRGGVGGSLWSLFPKLNFSWIAVDRQDSEPLFGILTLVRPRLAFGVAGTQPATDWKLRLAGKGSIISPGSPLTTPGLILTSLGNTELHPERTREVEGGIDLQLWGNRLELSVTLNNKLRLDAIEQLTVAPSVYGGSLKYFTNIGKVRNTNTELQIRALLIDNPTISWNIDASLSKNKNVLVTLNSEEPYIDLLNGTRLVEGYPLFGRWERPILGYTEPGAGGRLTVANVSVADSAVYMGQQIPNFELPVSTGVSLFQGRLSLNATFHYKDGLTQFNSGSEALLNNLYLNPEASLAEQASALVAYCPDARDRCTKYGLIQTVNVLRFSTLSIGYNVPRTFAQRFGVPSMSIALQGNNLGLLTNYRGKDPDVNSVTVGDATIDAGQLPQPRSWRLQIRLSN